jgi:hypothetical protein
MTSLSLNILLDWQILQKWLPPLLPLANEQCLVAFLFAQLALELPHLHSTFKDVEFSDERIALGSFPLQDLEHELSSSRQIRAEPDQPIDVLRIGPPCLANVLGISSTEADVWVVLARLVVVKLRHDQLATSLYSSFLPVTVDELGSILEMKESRVVRGIKALFQIGERRYARQILLQSKQ